MTEAKFTQEDHALAMTCAVEIEIDARPGVIWNLLTDAVGFPRWNSTVTGIDGEIRDGARIRLHVPGTRRTFTPRVSIAQPGRLMTWSDGFDPLFKGVRVFEVRERGGAASEFRMRERFSGVAFALLRRSMPDFGPIFTAYANDLRREAERTAHSTN